MIRRLVEAHYFQNHQAAKTAHLQFWLRELRTPGLLTEIARQHPALAKRLRARRPLLIQALAGDTPALEQALLDEEAVERKRDQVYWLPLRKELEAMRHTRLSTE
jgi:hypothetical protein